MKRSAQEIVDLLERNLDYMEGSPDFDERCRKAAHVAWTLRLLRPEVQRVGFLELPFLAYFAKIAILAGVDAACVLEWFELGALDSSGAIHRAARLARTMGVGVRAWRALMRMDFAEQQGEPVHALLRADPDAWPADPLAACEAELTRLRWSGRSRELIQAMEQAAGVEYGR